MEPDKDYVLGTHDEEIARLALQHRIWRPRALDAWRRAGFTVGQTILDVGCGPGWATLDLAEIVGPSGRILAIERSRRFLDVLAQSRRTRGLEWIEPIEADLDAVTLPPVQAHGAWGRWVFAFVLRPRELLERVHAALAPGGTLVLHEYFDYSTWRPAPRSDAFEEFVRLVMKSWRAAGGEPDIGLDLPGWLGEMGFEVRSMQPIVEVATPSSYLWQWPLAFMRNGLARLAALGTVTPERQQAIEAAFAACESDPRTFMITPGVLEVIAVKK